jgi:2',3'-cyclic-nucleotide 2'-phosphodiesterase (5'-nucleotidase family)
VVSLGFFSVTVPSNPQEFVYYGDIYTEAETAYTALKPTSDIIIGLTHLIVDQDVILAKKLKDVPLIMGGHEHNNMLVKEGSSVIAKADANAKTAYIHTLTYNTKTKTVLLDSELFTIDDSVPSSPKVAEIVDRWNKVLDEKIKEVIDQPAEVLYAANPPLDGTDSANRSLQTNLGAMITAGMSYAFNDTVDGVVVNGGSFRLDDMLEGNVTSMDIFRVLPFGGSIYKIDITGELLLQVLDYGKAESGTGAYLQRNNIEELPGGGWQINGKPIEGGKHYYTIAISDFLLKGYDIPFLTEDNPGVLKVYKPTKDEMAFDIRKAVILYLKSIK